MNEEEEAAYRARRARRQARRLVSRYAERLLENESWRSGLDDNEAQPLLAWGLAYLEKSAAQLVSATGEEVQAHLDAVTGHITALLAGIDSLLAGQGAATPPDLETRNARLQQLLSLHEALTQTPITHVQRTRLAQISAAYLYLGRRQLLEQLKSLFLPALEEAAVVPAAAPAATTHSTPVVPPPPSEGETESVETPPQTHHPVTPSQNEVSHEVWIE